ncbi:MAG: ribosomal L7Ae/L30e/S12e/Gadd45 family protein [Spirochaetales bacterium]
MIEEINLQKLQKLVNNSLKVVGRKQVLKAIIFSLDRTWCVVVAKDAKADVVDPILDLCKTKKVQVYLVPSKRELGNIAGVDVEASAIALLN